MAGRWGLTVPFDPPLGEQEPLFREIVELGYTDAWSAEAMGHDAFTPLALAAVWAPELRLGTAIVPTFTRGPALIAQQAATLAQVAPGRFLLGIGSSSNVIVHDWNAVPFVDPYKRTRDVLRFLRTALTGEKVTEQYDTFSVKNFRLGVRVPEPVPILVAGLREGMLRLAGREGDGAIINWLSADDVARVAHILDSVGGAGKEIVARLFVCPNPDRETVLAQAKFAIAAYVNVPVYRAFHEWLGRGDALGGHWERWAAGDRKGSLEEIPDQVVDELIIHGTADECRSHIERYFANGVTTASISIMGFGGIDTRQAIRDLAPGS